MVLHLHDKNYFAQAGWRKVWLHFVNLKRITRTLKLYKVSAKVLRSYILCFLIFPTDHIIHSRLFTSIKSQFSAFEFNSCFSGRIKMMWNPEVGWKFVPISIVLKAIWRSYGKHTLVKVVSPLVQRNCIVTMLMTEWIFNIK